MRKNEEQTDLFVKWLDIVVDMVFTHDDDFCIWDYNLISFWVRWSFYVANTQTLLILLLLLLVIIFIVIKIIIVIITLLSL